jgi:uncharacterized protein (DUF1499 family)
MPSITHWLPLFNDISTDTASPPVLHPSVNGAIAPELELEYPLPKGALQSFIYRDVQPLHANLTRETLYEVAHQIIQSRPGWEVVYENSTSFRTQAVVTTTLCRFHDDVVIEVRSDQKKRGAELHMRSRSRVGLTDLGTNARRIRKFISDVEKDLK